MRAGKPIVMACLVVSAGCEREIHHERSVETRMPVAAVGRVTRIDAANAPEVLPVPPERTVTAGPFIPVGNDGAVAGAIAHTRTFTTDDGLPMDDIMCAYRAPDGALWFGTNGGGITRYDGHSFTNYSMAHGLPDNTILSLRGDRQGNLWIGTSTGGLCRFDGHRFTTFTIGEGTGLAKGINCILEDQQGVLWFGSRGHGVFRYDGKDFTIMPVIDPEGRDLLLDMVLANDGSLWASTDHGLARYDGRMFRHVIPMNGDSLDDVISMVADADGSLWLGRENGGITRCAIDHGRMMTTDIQLLPGEPVRVGQMINGRGGTLWIGTTTHGALLFNPREQGPSRVRRLSTAQGLPSDEVLCVVMGRHGDVWLGSRGAGLTHYHGEALSTFRGIRPISMAEDPQGILWLGTTGGLARFDGQGFSEQRTGSGTPGWVYSVSIDPLGRAGFGRNMIDPRVNGISWFDGARYHVTSVPDDRKFPDIFWTLHDHHGHLWVGGRRGVERYADGQRTSYTTGQGLGSDLILSLAEDGHGSIWAGTDGGGVSRIDSTRVTTWTTEQGLPNNVVWTVLDEGRGTMWMTTLAGLCRFDGRTFLTFGTQQGLPDDIVNQALLARDRKALYVGTLNGLAVITGWRDRAGHIRPCDAFTGLSNDSLAAYEPVVEVYNASTGFPVKDIQTAEHSIFEDSKGIVWVATGSDKTGLVRLDRAALQPDTVPLTVQLMEVTLGNERVCWYDLLAGCDSTTLAQQEKCTFGRSMTKDEREAVRTRLSGVTFNAISPFFAVPRSLVLDHANDRIAFRFSGIETSRPEVVLYQYMLEGYDEDWSAPARTSRATYGNINEGEYVFKVKAKNTAGIWSAPLEYRFSVLPPWHRTWWAYALYVLAVGGGTVLYIRLRLAALKRQKAVLERTVDERTVELRHKKEEADQQRQRAELSEKAKEQFLANMSHEIRTPMNAIMGMSDILKNRPHPPEQDKFLHAITQSSENLLVIINDILDLTKIDAGRFEFEAIPFEPRTVLGNVGDILQFKAEGKGLALALEVDDAVPAKLIGDPTRLNQIVMNLAGNAVKFTERGGVTIRASIAERSIDRCSLVVAVSDTGIGIPEDRLEKIFEEFTQAYSDTTRKYGGTGLGLTISKRLAELQGGSISVTSQRDKGSTFTVAIPYGLG